MIADAAVIRAAAAGDGTAVAGARENAADLQGAVVGLEVADRRMAEVLRNKVGAAEFLQGRQPVEAGEGHPKTE